MSRMRKSAIALAGAVTLFVAGGIAFALWTSDGTGSGRATATVSVDATLNPVNGAPDLYPGFADGDVYFTVTNPNPYTITFTTMAATGVTSLDEAACPSANVTVDAATGLALVAPPGTSGTLSIADVVTMSADAPDGCQGASFDIGLTLTGEQTV